LRHRRKFLGGFYHVKANLNFSKRRTYARLLPFCAALDFAVAAWRSRAQDTGYIAGTVSDKSGAAIAGAKVLIAQ
jgi:hypothetical protein